MDAEYRRRYRELFVKHWWWRARSEFLVAALRRLHLNARQTAILDVGCGDGLFFERSAEFGAVEGIDVDAALPAASRWEKQIYRGAFDESFQPSRQYNLILMLDVLEHLADPAAALRNARRLLASDGCFLATVPAFQAAWTNHDVLNHHVRRFTKNSMGELLKRSGFRIAEQRYFFQWTFFAKLLVRGHEALWKRPPAVPRVPPPSINDLLYRLSHMEQAILGGLPLPVGSSLLVIARRES